MNLISGVYDSTTAIIFHYIKEYSLPCTIFVLTTLSLTLLLHYSKPFLENPVAELMSNILVVFFHFQFGILFVHIPSNFFLRLQS